MVAGCGASATKTVTVTKPPPASTAAAATGSSGSGATGATGTTNPAFVDSGDANTLLQELQTAWDSDNAGAGVDGILTYNVVYDYSSSGFTPIRGFANVRKHILGLLNSNGKNNKLALSGITIGNDGLGTYATGTWVSSNVNGGTGTFQIRFAPPGPSPFRNDPCTTMPCIQQITLVPTPAPPVQGQGQG
jgi:hypothetical protein